MSNRRDEPASDYDPRIDEDQERDSAECEHPRAEVQELEYSKPSFWADAGISVNDDSEDLPTLVCPDCGHEEVLERSVPDYDE